MKYKLLILIIASAVMLCSCANDTEAEVTETTSETSATTFNEYILTRGWDGDELLASIFYCGEFHPLPMSIEDCPDFVLSDGILYFPDGSHAAATTDGNGKITALEFNAASAPFDFSVYGIDFFARPYDIQEKVGFANSVMGDENTEITFGYSGGGINQLVFRFENEQLVSVYISA